MHFESNLLLGIGLLLLLGFAASKVSKLLRLPSVIGYILTGACLGLMISPEHLARYGGALSLFSNLGLMFIAFTMGENLHLKELRSEGKTIVVIALVESLVSFFVVTLGFLGLFLLFTLLPTPIFNLSMMDSFWIALLLGAMSMASSPATTMAVLHEYKSLGVFSKMLLSVITLDSALSLLVFALVFTVTGDYLEGSGDISWLKIAFVPLAEIGLSLVLGLVLGGLLSSMMRWLKERHEILIVNMGMLVLASGVAVSFGLSPILIGIVAGTLVVNLKHSHSRTLSVFYDLEPTILALFFILVSSHLNPGAILTTGLFGLIYFALRTMGKSYGCGLGAQFVQANQMVRKYLGLSLIPQASMAIGMLFLIQSDPRFSVFEHFMTMSGLAAILMSEIVGAIMTKVAVARAEEDTRRMALFNQAQ